MPRQPLVVIPGDDPPLIAESPHLERLQQAACVELYRDRPATDVEQVRRVQNARVVLNSRGQVRWPGSVLSQLPELRLIACCAIGTDCVDLKAAAELGIAVCNVPGRTKTIVAEHALALMLATARRLSFLTAEMKAGRWSSVMSTSLIGKTLGVVGTGNIGCEMIRLARAIGMQVIAWSFHPSPEKAATCGFTYVELEELLQTADVVSLHCKLTDDSRGLIGASEIQQMKRGSLLINMARGAIVDTAALVDALNDGHLAGAGLDVYATEPLPADDPILMCDHVVLTPHSADQLPEGIDALCAGGVDNVLSFLAGEPQNLVTPR